MSNVTPFRLATVAAAPPVATRPAPVEPPSVPPALAAEDAPSRASLALAAWRQAGAVRSNAQLWRDLLERVPGDAAWTRALDRAHAAITELMAALSDIQGASGEVAHAELVPEDAP